MLACADIEEGIVLREAGVRAPILVFGALSVSDLDGMFDARPDADDLDAVGRARAAGGGRDATASRLALPSEDRHRHEPARVPPRQPRAHAAGGRREPRTSTIDAVYTHFATADDPEHPAVRRAARALRARRCATLAGARHHDRASRHAANSAALLRDERVWYDFVRPGPAALRHRPAAARRRRCRCDLPCHSTAVSWR